MKRANLPKGRGNVGFTFLRSCAILTYYVQQYEGRAAHELCDRNEIQELLQRHGFRFSKSMGQNFLIDPQIPADIAAASGADETCGVLEIGPGIGPLTAELAQRAGKVAAVEFNPETLADHFKRHGSDLGRCTSLCGCGAQVC